MGWRDKISPKHAWNESIVMSCIFILLGIYMTSLSIHHLFFPWTKSDFVQLTGTIKGSPVFNNRKNESLEISLNEVKDFIFSIDGDNYTVLRKKALKDELQHGDTVFLLIDKNQYEAKISKERPPTFKEEMINWKWIRVFEFKSQKATMLDFNEVINELKHVAKFYLIFGIICLIGTYFYLRYEFRIYQNLKHQKSSIIKNS
jgi:hypothetical protein